MILNTAMTFYQAFIERDQEIKSRGWHSNRDCTLNCDLGWTYVGQNFYLSWHCIDFTIVGFIAEILLDLDQLDRIYQRDIVA